MSSSTRFIDILKNFDLLPDSAVVPTAVTAAVTSLSDKTVRHILPRVYVSADRYGQRVGDVRKRLSEGTPPAEIRLRVGPVATRLLSEVQAAPSRAEAEKIVAAFDAIRMNDDEYERLQALQTGGLNWRRPARGRYCPFACEK